LRPGIDWIGLQKEIPAGDAAPLASHGGIRDVSAHLHDFAETAAAVDQLDLLVTVDTSIAHVAGALGKPVWILLPHGSHDWRWLLEREDSLWYPTARLFRQPAPGDWESVAVRVRDELGSAFDV
ncbi:MAG TPA: glycosyltransferase family 9 protein, partial [Usitatibacter sp.]|nr:glycosyltransferase family 9 protein [Usitatibacter sp.]